MNKLIIVGCADLKEPLPWDDENYDIWGHASCLFHPERYRLDKVFYIVHKSELKKKYIDKCKESGLPIYSKDKIKGIENNPIFPLKQIQGKYGMYFTTVFSYVLCYAVEQGYKDITLRGMAYEDSREMIVSRPNIEYYIGYFRAKGINVIAKEDLCTCKKVYATDKILDEISRIQTRIDKLESDNRIYSSFYHITKTKKNKREYQQMIEKNKRIIERLDWDLRYL